MRDRCMNGIFKRAECTDIPVIELCTEWLFCPVFIIALYVQFILNKCYLIIVNKERQTNKQTNSVWSQLQCAIIYWHDGPYFNL